MEEQAGIYRFDLYENKGISLIFTDKNTIQSISNTGAVISVENSDCNTIDLGFEFEHRRSGNNKLQYKNTITWKQLGLTDANLDLISQLKQSIYQWIPVIEFYKTGQKIILNPLQYTESVIDNNVSNSYMITLRNAIFGQRIKDFVPLTGEQNFISTDTPGLNIADDYIVKGNEKITLS